MIKITLKELILVCLELGPECCSTNKCASRLGMFIGLRLPRRYLTVSPSPMSRASHRLQAKKRRRCGLFMSSNVTRSRYHLALIPVLSCSILKDNKCIIGNNLLCIHVFVDVCGYVPEFFYGPNIVCFNPEHIGFVLLKGHPAPVMQNEEQIR